MKATVTVITAVLVLSQTVALRLPDLHLAKGARTGHVTFITPAAKGVGLDKCKDCINIVDEVIQETLNLLLNGVVVDGCTDLCELVVNKTGKAALGDVCMIICTFAGFDEFVHLIERADIDPIYYCEEMKRCVIFDGGDAKITSFTVTPKSGPQGEFDLAFDYTSQNGTGTGEIDIDVDTVDGIPLGQGFLHEPEAAGSYSTGFKLRAEPDPDCDPTQQPCEEWLPGDYTVKIAICNGECGSKHPHSQVYDQAETTFTITQ